ncbi:hypothetical protein P170DRAFT_478509 [Aspergillus steynii IBT 23096]|uniref:Integral membrane protein n=1 Tax=Aspergillus steynii IBT 23096 TaxID=1392250 RepID=A0A2I2FY54_9EURO|nr:uncharacterized protein P170DRAFT_478509 [Aspergillus steynii IBT 23096]PLB45552.1 hypothetical protein P170DRAFT_478509 [Aspergillus steynii IBT 23096]
MAPQDTAGRIPKKSFISTSVLLGLTLVGVLVRFLIRFRIQRQRPNVDDGLLAMALALLLISIGFMHEEVIDRMYFIVALQRKVEGVIPSPDWMQVSFQFHKWVTICLMMSWSAIMAVKFSFLFFFKRLIDRIRPWWIFDLSHKTISASIDYHTFFDPPRCAVMTFLAPRREFKTQPDTVFVSLVARYY